MTYVQLAQEKKNSPQILCWSIKLDQFFLLTGS